MADIKAVIVDDSPFSIAVIKDILENNGVEVAGSASSLEEVRTVVRTAKPNLVTMDITMPGTDGFECTRAVHEVDKNIKVIMISSMMDDEVLEDASKHQISTFIQKPIIADELLAAVKRVFVSDDLYDVLMEEYMTVFKESLRDNINRMTRSILTYEAEQSGVLEYEPMGVDIIMGIVGKFSGKMLLGLSRETAKNLTSSILKREPKNDDEITFMMSEFGNIVSGNACSVLNRKNKVLGLRVAPPSILFGDNIYMSPSKFPTKTVRAKTIYGSLLLNVGFKSGDER